MFMEMFTNPEFAQVYFPVIIRGIAVLFALVLLILKVGLGVSWKAAFQKVISKKKIILWILLFVAAVILPGVVMPLVGIATNAIVLLFIIAGVAILLRNPNSKLCDWVYNLRAKKPIWNDLFHFWESLLKNKTRAVALAITIAAEPSVLDMVISVAILILVTWGVSKFWSLSQIDWRSNKAQKAATAILVVIAFARVLLRIGLSMSWITALICVGGIAVGILLATRKKS